MKVYRSGVSVVQSSVRDTMKLYEVSSKVVEEVVTVAMTTTLY